MNKLVIAAIVVVIVIIIIVYMASMKASAAPATATPAALPSGIVNGGVYRCANDGAIYIVQGGKKQHYLTAASYAAAGSPAWTAADCGVLASIPSGADI